MSKRLTEIQSTLHTVRDQRARVTAQYNKLGKQLAKLKAEEEKLAEKLKAEEDKKDG